MAEESSDQKVTGDDQKAVFTSIKDSFFDDPFFKVLKKKNDQMTILSQSVILYHFLLKKIKIASTRYSFLQFTDKCTFGYR